jgi:hypothetical protein
MSDEFVRISRNDGLTVPPNKQQSAGYFYAMNTTTIVFNLVVVSLFIPVPAAGSTAGVD